MQHALPCLSRLPSYRFAILPVLRIDEVRLPAGALVHEDRLTWGYGHYANRENEFNPEHSRFARL